VGQESQFFHVYFPNKQLNEGVVVMKKVRIGLIGLMVLTVIALPFIVWAAPLINDTYADGNSQNQDLGNNSIRLFNGRANTTVRVDAPGSVTFDMTNTGASAEAFWGYFTNPGSPVTLKVGDKLTVSGTFVFTNFTAGGQDIRFGVLNSLGTRNANNFTGGMNESTFTTDTGYALDFFPSGSGSPFVIWRRTTFTSGNVFNSSGDFTAITPGTGATTRQTLASNTPYTLNYTIERLTATDTKISVAVTGGTLNNLNFTATETSANPNTAFDYFGFRVGGNPIAQKIQFTDWLIDYTPGLPVITSQPQPTSLTVQVGSNVTMAVGASGNQLSYQWNRNGSPISPASNPTAATPTLNLTNVQLGDAGSYTATVTNLSGSVNSNAVTLNVSVDPVPPPPSIVTPPTDTTVTVNQPGSLSVAATGDNLFYQWFKNNTIIPGATNATLNFASAQITDSANYSVVVSNSSGSVTSNPAKLLVVSAMTVSSFAPANGATNLCIDSPLKITFNQPVKAGNTGRLRVFQDDGTLVDTIDMSLPTQSRLNGTVNFNYFPIITNGNTATIYLHQKLNYDRTYYVTAEPGVVTDANNAPFAGVSDITSWQFSTRTDRPATGASSLVVAADGTGDYCTVQGAIDFVPANNTRRVVILVKKGTYTEIVYVNSNKPFITVRGEDRDQTIIQYANNNTFNPTSTTTRSMFGTDGADFSLENITLINTTPKGGSQAETFRGNAQRIVLNHVTLKSFQDTLLLQSPGTSNQGGFVTDSYIEGDVDFMWGTGAVFFQNCELKMLTSNAYYTMIRNVSGKNGNVYLNCRLTAAPGVTGSYLSRIDPTVFPFSQVVYINTQRGSQVIPAGWLLTAGTTAPNVSFWEYNSRDANGNPIDISQRAAFSRQLSAAEAAQWSDPSFVLGGWNPSTKLTAAVTLNNLNQTFTGSPIAATATTDPAGLNVNVTYNGSPTPPTALGSYNVVATIDDPTYQGSATGTLVISPVFASVTLGRLFQVYDGSPRQVSLNVTPPGTPVTVTYNGSTLPPTDPGNYSVVATVTDPNFRGGTSATLTVYAADAVPLRAFPGAEGAGAFTPGGRGGDVYHVTNLNDSGAGSLRFGIESATGPRTIVFDVSGTIFNQSRLNINKPFLTLAGQTAPGDGITVAGWTTSVNSTHDVIVRYMRFRPGDINCPNYQDDGFDVDKSTNVIADHVSASWSVDETLSVTESNNVTIQWAFITESMKNSCHIKGAHGYGSLIRYLNGLVSYHHNLYAHHDSRNPRLGDNIGLDFVNNVIFDWGSEAGYSGDATEGTPRLNYVGNYLIAGPDTPSSKRGRAFNGGSTNTLIYQANNSIDSNLNGAHDGTNTEWGMFIGAYTQQSPARFQFPQINTDDSATAYNRVLNLAGATLVRDSVDTRVVSEVQNETGRHIDSQSQVGGWPTLNSLPAPPDADQDGMPDSWETDHGLNPANPADGAAIGTGGYTNLENYLNDLVPAPDADKDHTAPATTMALSQPPNANGWNNTDVTVMLNSSDGDGTGVREVVYTVNGIQFHSFTAAVSIPLTSEGVNTVSWYAKDKAGNSEPENTLTVKIDKTAPNFTNNSRTPANSNGWNSTDVEASFTAHDAVSGFDSGDTQTGSFTFSAEGAAQSHTFTVTDLAGNSASFTVSDVNIDKTAPAINAGRSPAPNANGWNNTDVLASYTAEDALSGFASGQTTAGSFTFSLEGANQSHTFTVSDLAGNTTSATVSNVNIDKTGPSINAVKNPAPNSNGWNNTAVTVSFNAADGLSGVASFSGPVTITTEGANQLVNGSATDLAGNTSTTSTSVSIDKTAPELFIQFDPTARDLQVFGRDGLSGVPPGPIVPVISPDPSHNRTYRVVDLAGNNLTIVLRVSGDAGGLHATVISWSYQDGPATDAPTNKFNLDWKTNPNGSFKELEQLVSLYSGRDRQSVQASYDSSRNVTTIKVDGMQPFDRPVMGILKLTTNNGQLGIEY
jgi:pectin methylesterase-like acyl-CoA thioesterase